VWKKEKQTMKALDLFCGLGGWSDGLVMEGFEVLGVEINPKIAELYKHPCLIADVRELNGRMFKTFDLIVGSPPCRDFSVAGYFGKKYWKIPPNPEKGMSLVNAFLRIIEEVEPKFWLMENVPRLEIFLEEKPNCIAKLTKYMQRAFWGNFPQFLIPMDTAKPRIQDFQGKLRKWKRAKIPLPVARALGKAVRTRLGVEEGETNK